MSVGGLLSRVVGSSLAELRGWQLLFTVRELDLPRSLSAIDAHDCGAEKGVENGWTERGEE